MGEDRLKLIPVYEKKALMNAWPHCIEGAEAILKHTVGDTSLEKIFNGLFSGHLLLWVGFNAGKYCGFFTTKFDVASINNKSLDVVHLYIKKGVDKNIFYQGFDELKKFAKESNCTSLKFWTIRDKAFEKKMKPLGWERGYQEFIYTL